MKSETLDEVLQTVRIAAAHHRDLIELAVDDRIELVSAIQDAGDVLDVALVIAYLDGAKIFDLWKAARLPVGYVAALTSGTL